VPVFDLITIPELKRHVPFSGNGQDAFAAEEISRASRTIEQYLDRRIVYRAPGEDEQNDNAVASASWASGSFSIASQPGTGGRTLIVTWDVATSGALTVTGTVNGAAGTTEVFEAANGRVQHGVKFFTAISAVAAVNAQGSGTVKLGYSQGYVEYHTPHYPSELATIEWPIRQVAEVNEDLNLVFGSTTALTTAQYQIRHERRCIARVSGGLDFPWYAGRRVVKVTYSAGYFGTANVPQDLKQVACRLVGWSMREALRQQHGQQSGTDASGTFAVVGPAMLTTGMKAQLDLYIRGELFDRSGERDFDLEAA
jgi:hypothetical protein